jgi:hypothetical protein
VLLAITPEMLEFFAQVLDIIPTPTNLNFKILKKRSG